MLLVGEEMYHLVKERGLHHKQQQQAGGTAQNLEGAKSGWSPINLMSRRQNQYRMGAS